MDYEKLKLSYNLAMKICDPIDFQVRLRDLLHTVAGYLVERDMPEEEIKSRNEQNEKAANLEK